MDKTLSDLSPKQKRVAIAKDAIAQIKANRLVPKHDVYLREFGGNASNDRPVSVESTPDMRVADRLQGRRCEVCAIGALFVAAVDTFNGVTCGEMIELSGCRMARRLEAFFPEYMLDKIEAAFEGWENIREIHDSADSAEERLVAVLERIIEDDGDPKFVRAYEEEDDDE